MDHETERRLLGLTRLVGNTPLLALDFAFRGERRVLYAKAEHLNLTGSIKDRMALEILRQAYLRSALRPGDLIVEATSGNTGLSLASLGRALGHPVALFMPDWMSRERVDLLRAAGADVVLVTAEEGGFLASIRRAEELAATAPRAFLPRQFSNEDNVLAHRRSTGPEIWMQLRLHSLLPDAFVAGVGTGGTLMGVGRFLRERRPQVRLHPVEPASSPTLSLGRCVGRHRIQGISDEFVPAIVELDFLDAVASVEGGDAILMAQKLAREAGLAVGISSGANFLGALRIQNELGPDAIVVTVFPDDNRKYLSTDLLGDEPVKDGFLSPEVRLLGFRVFRRVCETCLDPFEQTQTHPLEGDVAHSGA